MRFFSFGFQCSKFHQKRSSFFMVRTISDLNLRTPGSHTWKSLLEVTRGCVTELLKMRERWKALHWMRFHVPSCVLLSSLWFEMKGARAQA